MSDINVKSLHPIEVKLLLNAKAGEDFSSSVGSVLNAVGEAHINQAISWCLQKGFITKVSEKTTLYYSLTEKGRAVNAEGFVTEKILSALKDGKSLSLKTLASVLGVEQSDAGSSFALLKKSGSVNLTADKILELASGELPEVVQCQKSLITLALNKDIEDSTLDDVQRSAILAITHKNKTDEVFKSYEVQESFYQLTELGIQVQGELNASHITGDEVGQITREMLKTGAWKNVNLREYDVENTPAAKLLAGRLNPYSAFISSVKDKLVSLGFEEFDGPLVETEFYNGDCLFMPQFHPARDIHDVYYIQDPKISTSISDKDIDKVAAIHTDGGSTSSRGWGYKFDRDFTRRMLLRSQGTVLSAHKLKTAKVPGKYFGVVRCFRYDAVDATHGADFYQTEGIVLGKEANLKTLMGLLKIFATEFAGAEEVKYVPGYFPFTEPSVEVHIKHPKLGWFELGGSGIFREEVTAAWGINCPVLAWGIGIDRMALMKLGLSDIRDLFAQNIDTVREMLG